MGARRCATGRALVFATLAACSSVSTPPDGVLVVANEQTNAWIRNFNPLVASGSSRWPTRAGIHEPLLVYSVLDGAWQPWLATSWQWEADGSALRFTLRESVHWSDGTEFSPDDVVATFHLLRDHPALDSKQVWKHVSGVRVDKRDVVFDFRHTHSPALADIAHQPIVPAHIWNEVDDPVRFTNPNPVGTGPFTEVRRFETQIWELGANPHYWQPGRPAFDALRMPAFPSNEQSALALLREETDWSGNFVPAIERIFRKPDPEHHHYWFPLTGSTVFLYAQTRRPLLARSDVRRAISLAIDREQLVEVAMYRHTVPAHPSALSDAYAAWRDDTLLRDASPVRHAPTEAEALLDAAGLHRGVDGLRHTPDGEPIRWTLDVVAGWSDWVRASQVIARNLRDIGLDVRVSGQDFNTWYQRISTGDFDLSIGWSALTPTPHGFYAGLMGPDSVRDPGVASPTGWSRHSSPRMGDLLHRFAGTTDGTQQHDLARQMQRVFVDEFPAVPLFPGPSWGSHVSRRFRGWPSAEAPYARLDPNAFPDSLLVMTRLEPT